MKILLSIAALAAGPLMAAEGPPPGFTPIFNGQNIAGWHISMTNHHGDTSEWRIADGALTARQNRPGNGGILLTDEEYGDFEIYLEIKPDFGCDGGLFLRSTESGQAYQVMLDYLEGGNVGGVYGERLEGVESKPSENWREAWKEDDWNALRARIEGEAPHIQVWLNGERITDFEADENHLPTGRTHGHIALQIHGGDRCNPDLQHRFRNVAVKPLD